MMQLPVVINQRVILLSLFLLLLLVGCAPVGKVFEALVATQVDGPESPPGNYCGKPPTAVCPGDKLKIEPSTITFGSTETTKTITVTGKDTFVFPKIFFCKTPCNLNAENKINQWVEAGVFDGTPVIGTFLSGTNGVSKQLTLNRDDLMKGNNFILIYTCQGSGLCNNRKWVLQKFTVTFELAATCTDGVKNGAETDVDCGGSCTTKCAINKGCLADGDCSKGKKCDPVSKICVTCYDNTHCASYQKCDMTTKTCVNKCLGVKCSGGICNPTTGTCVACLYDVNCPPKCDATGEICTDQHCYMPTKTCGDCATNDQCNGRICDGGTCRNCRDTSDCGGKQCDTTSGRCVDCLTDAQCGVGKHCDLSPNGVQRNTCYGECNRDIQCPSPKRCDYSSTTCVECTGITDCPDFHICTSSHTCAPCTSDTQCSFPAGVACSAVRCINGGCRFNSGYNGYGCKYGEEDAYNSSTGGRCCYKLCATDADCVFGRMCSNYNCVEVTLPKYSSCYYPTPTQCRAGLSPPGSSPSAGKCVCGQTSDVGTSCNTPQGVSCECSGYEGGMNKCIPVFR